MNFEAGRKSGFPKAELYGRFVGDFAECEPACWLLKQNKRTMHGMRTRMLASVKEQDIGARATRISTWICDPDLRPGFATRICDPDLRPGGGPVSKRFRTIFVIKLYVKSNEISGRSKIRFFQTQKGGPLPKRFRAIFVIKVTCKTQ